MTTKDKIARRKLSLLELAKELSNVSRAFIEGLPRPEPKGAPQTKPKKPASLQSETRAA